MTDASGPARRYDSCAEADDGVPRRNRALAGYGPVTRNVDEAMGEAVDRIETLNEATAEITEAAELIRDIAEQTNVLALDAPIEAARVGGGGDGDGFAVVAEEAKRLAEDTGDRADPIAETLDEVRAETERAVEAIRETSEQVSDGSDAGAPATAADRDGPSSRVPVEPPQCGVRPPGGLFPPFGPTLPALGLGAAGLAGGALRLRVADRLGFRPLLVGPVGPRSRSGGVAVAAAACPLGVLAFPLRFLLAAPAAVVRGGAAGQRDPRGRGDAGEHRPPFG